MKRKQRRETSIKRSIEYENVGNPWVMLAAMIFCQARDDAYFLADNRTSMLADHTMLNKFEIVNFLRSDWAHMLASYIDVTEQELKRLEQAVLGGV